MTSNNNYETEQESTLLSSPLSESTLYQIKKLHSNDINNYNNKNTSNNIKSILDLPSTILNSNDMMFDLDNYDDFMFDDTNDITSNNNDSNNLSYNVEDTCGAWSLIDAAQINYNAWATRMLK